MSGVYFFTFLFLAAAPLFAKPLVFVSIPPQAWLVKRIAGDSAEVHSLMAAGSNPHTFEPTGRQMKALSGASLYLTIGMTFEKPLLASAVAINPRLAVAAMDAGIAKIADRDGEGGNPHIWLDPSLYCVMATNAFHALSEWRTDVNFEAGLSSTVAQIQKVDADVRDELSKAAGRAWAVYHPSWCYFSKAYGWTLFEESSKRASRLPRVILPR